MSIPVRRIAAIELTQQTWPYELPAHAPLYLLCLSLDARQDFRLDQPELTATRLRTDLDLTAHLKEVHRLKGIRNGWCGG